VLIDMHNHTRVSSPCSLLSAPELIEAARARGLDAICVTEHLYVEGANVAQEIGRQVGFPVFRGVEARTDLGDMLVFGYYRDIPQGISLEELCTKVHQVGGLVFVAHPYHEAGGWNLVASMRARGLDLDTDWDRLPVLRELDGVEILNGQVADEINGKARLLAARLQLPGIGGSDSHLVRMVGAAATRFEAWIQSEEQLIAALKSGRFEAIRLAG
jgi:predicted metal-dependent phosphoesterase TrpH